MKTTFFLLIFIFFFKAESQVINEHFADNIKTVLIQNIENELLDPIINLNSNEQLLLSFDEIGTDLTNYKYSFVHCNSKWEKSDLIESDYLDGFYENYIEEYFFSFNTSVDYTNYQCIFPNENINFLKSGFYFLIVKNEDTEEEIIKKKFVIYEDIVKVKARSKRATYAKDIESKQEIDFEVFYSNLEIFNPSNELNILIQKNDEWLSTKKAIKPTQINNQSIKFDYDEELSFNGGNEFREFNSVNLNFYSKNIDTIYFKNKLYFVELITDEPNSNRPYFEQFDLNGKFIVKRDNSFSSKNESEYVNVKFSLKNNNQNLNEKIFIFGQLTNWLINQNFLLKYNEKSKKFETELLLKQGYYNYQYVTLKNNLPSTEEIEGNYYETNNEYTIYVFHKNPWSRYERLVGVEKITSNSLN
tara:strand:+ start:24811 stop:26058 length:1248 start_codon:yes stop_codon:yes gene_type:complete